MAIKFNDEKFYKLRTCERELILILLWFLISGVMASTTKQPIVSDVPKTTTSASQPPTTGTIKPTTVASSIRDSKKQKPVVKKVVRLTRKQSKLLFKGEVDIDDHKLTVDEILKRYQTNLENGLSDEEAMIRLNEDGPNALTPPRQLPKIIILLRHIFHGFSLLLWAGAMLCYSSYFIAYAADPDAEMDNLWLATVLVLVCLVTGIFSYTQESKSSKLMESFAKMVPYFAHVKRNGEKRKVPSTELVRGDVVSVKIGDRLPADIRIVECDGFKVDNSSLTGETEPQNRNSEVSEAVNYLEAENLAFFSTNALSGWAVGVVIMTGDRTSIGRIAGLSSRIVVEETPIAREIDRFMRRISAWAIFLGVSFFTMAWLIGYELFDAALFFIAIIVANVPEGLLPTVTVCLSLTAKRMAYKNCVVRNLEAVETLGSTSTICSDKTGTLTQNRMTVTNMVVNLELVPVTYAMNPTGVIGRVRKSPYGQAIIRAAGLCNRAEFRTKKEKEKDVPTAERDVIGDATEVALLRFVQRAIASEIDRMRETHGKVFEVPFNSTNKFQLSIHKLPAGGLYLLMKGAPEVITARCSQVMVREGFKELNDKVRQKLEVFIDQLAELGERVIAFADITLPSKYTEIFDFQIEPPNIPLMNLNLIGFLSMMDPPRLGVPDAVEKCRSAGIRVIMVTGDHPKTAKAIAKRVGILSADTLDDIARKRKVPLESVHLSESSSIVLTGAELRELSTEQLKTVLRTHREIVFARTSPTQKLQIVEGCQSLGEIVAVTGDGVNDSPALKKADIGIAMGITGSDVSKQAADMILLDDDFSSIVIGIEEGRLIFDNLKKTIAYILASNVPEIVPFLLFISMSIPLPLGVFAVLCIDLGTDMWPAISLAYEKSEADIMRRPPRNPFKDKLVTGKLIAQGYARVGIIEATAGMFTYFTIMAQNGWMPGDLLGIRAKWDSKYVDDVADSFGQEWTYSDRKVLEYTCQISFFVSVVVMQWVNLLVCKTRYNSLFQQGMFNWVLNFGLIFETLVTCFVCYFPAVRTVSRAKPVSFITWLLPIPFVILVFLMDEFRKYRIRKHPDTWMEKHTYY